MARQIGPHLRRRESNTGYKAGNIRDFCARWGNDYELAVTLDADSFMPAEAILRLVRIMQADPKLGILQGLSSAAIDQHLRAHLSIRHALGMRSYTIAARGASGDCGRIGVTRGAASGAVSSRIANCRHSGGHISATPDRGGADAPRGYDVRVLPEDDWAGRRTRRR